METLAPPVVAVVVAHDPGPWFEETLASLASQDYAELSVLVLDAASQEDLTERVAAVLPAAYVRRFEENRGFGATVNEVLAMVDGADYFLLCHDDVALVPRRRPPAGRGGVPLQRRDRLAQGGQLGRPRPPGPRGHDRGQGGLGGRPGAARRDRPRPARRGAGRLRGPRRVPPWSGPTCSRSSVASTRTSWPWARTSTCAGGPRWSGPGSSWPPTPGSATSRSWPAGLRSVDPSLAGGRATSSTRSATAPVTLQELQRRHELLAVFKCYGPFHLIRVVPQVFVLALGEVIVAELAGNRARARAVVRAWRWNLGRLR